MSKPAESFQTIVELTSFLGGKSRRRARRTFVAASVCLLAFIGHTYWLATNSSGSVPRVLFYGIEFLLVVGGETNIVITRSATGLIEQVSVDRSWFNPPPGEHIEISPQRSRDGLWAPTRICGPTVVYYPAPTAATPPGTRWPASVPEDCVAATRAELVSNADTKLLSAFNLAMSAPEEPGGSRTYVETIPSGYIHNVVALLLVFATLLLLRRAHRDRKAGKRLIRHTCPRCSYSLLNLRQCRCPECGWEPGPGVVLASAEHPIVSRGLVPTSRPAVGTTLTAKEP